MDETCMICHKKQPRHVIRFSYTLDSFFELDLCTGCYTMVDEYKPTIRKVDGI